MAIENRGPQLQAACITLVTAAIISTALRCYVRIRLVKNFGFDDWCMLAALTSFILFVTCALIGVHYGTGRHHADLANEDIVQAMKYWWFCYMWYCLAMIASKISIGYFLLRITVRKLDVWIIYSVMVITVLTGVVFFFVTLFQCNPINYFWLRFDDGASGTCVDAKVIMALTYLYSVFSVISDFTCAILPMFLIWKLNMGRKTKLALIPIMTMACIASAAVVVRFPFVKNFDNPDFLWATVDIAIWSNTEQGLAITAGSLATLRPLLRQLGQKFGISSTGPSILHDSDQPMGRQTFGQKLPSDQPRGHFNLSTYPRDDQDGRGSDEEAGYARKDHIKSKGDNADSIWRSREDNNSEEQLTGKGSKTDQKIVKVTTFSVENERL